MKKKSRNWKGIKTTVPKGTEFFKMRRKPVGWTKVQDVVPVFPSMTVEIFKGQRNVDRPQEKVS